MERKFKIVLILTVSLLWLVPLKAVCLAATYYVDARNGNDNNDGLSPGTAWKTIAKVNSRTLSPGDSVLFKSGEVWREQLTVPSSGNAGAPITFAAYGTGEKPEINGANVITGWSVYRGNIYVADVSSKVTQLFVDGERQTRARWPNVGWQNIDANSGNNTSLYSNSLTQPYNYWVGATIWVKTQLFKIEAGGKVVSNSGNTIYMENALTSLPQKDYGFYLEGKVEEIDIPGEWCYDAGKVYLWMVGGDNPANHLIEGSVRENGIEMGSGGNKKYIDVENIKVKCASTYAIYIQNCDYVNIKDNVILFGGVGIKAYSYPNLLHGHIYIKRNSISEIQQGDGTWGGAGIWASGLNQGEITNNQITDIVSDGRSARFACGIMWSGKDLLISGNRIDRVSYNGISGGGDQVTISHNVISNCLLLLGDGGGIYTTGNPTDFRITNNIVNDVMGNLEGTPYSGRGGGVGIYLDEISAGYEVAGNIVFDCDIGMLLHRAYNNTLVNNTLYNNNVAMWLSEKAPNEMHDNNIYNNALLCAVSDQLTWYEGTYPGSTAVTKGKYDYNLHYNPYRKDVIIYTKGGAQRYTLDTWRAFSGQDGHSIAQDPLFVNTSNRDFHLKSNSPCIDAGVDVGLTQDFEGNPIPQGSAPDIGAYEAIKPSVNRPPVLNPIGNKTVNEGVLLVFNISATDPNGDTLTYSASNLPQGATFNPTTKTFSWTPTYDQAGIYPNVHFEVTDGSLSDSEDITITVNDVPPAPGAPVLDPIGNKSVDENTLLSFTVNATDPEGDPLTYSASNLPQGATFNPTTKTFTWTSTYDQAGIYNNVHFEVSDGTATDSEDITITVNNVNRAPVLDPIGDKSINEGQTLGFKVSGSDPDGDSLTYSASNLPQGANFDAVTRTFSWTPTYDQAGIYPNVHFEVRDSSSSDSEDITITVNNVNRAPILDTIGNKSITENQTLTFTVNATDPDGDQITYSAQGLPNGAIFQNQTFTWTPTASDVGSHEVTFIASDGSLSDSEKIVIEVKLDEEIKVKIKFNTDRISKIGILYISGETNEGAVIKEVKVLNESNKILDIDMKDKVSMNGEKYITGIVIVIDIIKKYPLLGGIKVRIKVAMGEKTKEGETGMARIEPYAAGPDRIGVYNNVFNPLKGEKTLIRIDIAKQTHIKINLYDTKGKKIKELADGERDAGMPRYYWDGKDDSGNIVGSGLYFVHIQAGDYEETKKIVVVK